MLYKKIKKRIIQFGAGNIGRSFIGQLFSRSGYEVVFVDINKKLNNKIKRAFYAALDFKAKDEKGEMYPSDKIFFFS